MTSQELINKLQAIVAELSKDSTKEVIIRAGIGYGLGCYTQADDSDMYLTTDDDDDQEDTSKPLILLVTGDETESF